MLGYIERREFSRIAKTEKNIEDKEKYTEMLNKLIDALVDKPTTQLNATLVLADFLQENSMFEKANKQIQKTGFITEDAWIIPIPSPKNS